MTPHYEVDLEGDPDIYDPFAVRVNSKLAFSLDTGVITGVVTGMDAEYVYIESEVTDDKGKLLKVVRAGINRFYIRTFWMDSDESTNKMH